MNKLKSKYNFSEKYLILKTGKSAIGTTRYGNIEVLNAPPMSVYLNDGVYFWEPCKRSEMVAGDVGLCIDEKLSTNSEKIENVCFIVDSLKHFSTNFNITKIELVDSDYYSDWYKIVKEKN